MGYDREEMTWPDHGPARRNLTEVRSGPRQALCDTTPSQPMAGTALTLRYPGFAPSSLTKTRKRHLGRVIVS